MRVLTGRDGGLTHVWRLKWDMTRHLEFESDLEAKIDRAREKEVVLGHQGVKTDDILTELMQLVWQTAEETCMVSKSLLVENEGWWGREEDRLKVIQEDLGWLECGKMRRRQWWDAECISAQRLARRAEAAFRRCRKRAVNQLGH